MTQFAKTYAKYYDLLNQNKPYRKECNFIYKWADRPRTMLDIGCGTADYWKHWPEGTIVIGVEKSQEMVKQSKYSLHIKEGDMNNMVFPYSVDCVTALFDVINYIPEHDWWHRLPLKKGGYFIFDIWDKDKVDKEGFRQTIKRIGNVARVITPLGYNGKRVSLNIIISDGLIEEAEIHEMYLYDENDIKRFCGKDFNITGKKETDTWQMWYRLQKK